MEPGSVADWVSTASNVVMAGAALAAAVQGIRSLNSWRHELVGRRKAELAEEVLSAVFEAQEVINWARHPAGYLGDGSSRSGRAAEPQGQQQVRDGLFTPIERLNKHPELWSRLRTLAFRYRVIFGDAEAARLEEVLNVRQEVIYAASDLLEMQENGEDQRDPNAFKRIKKVARGHGEDEINRRLAAAVDGLAKDCRQAIGANAARRR